MDSSVKLREGIKIILSRWNGLQMAIKNEWGSHDSLKKSDQLASDILSCFSQSKDDSSSPYYLHPSDNPGTLLVSEIFNGENYVAWSRSIVIALTVKNKKPIAANGSITKYVQSFFSTASRRSQRQLTNSVHYNETHALMAKQISQQNYQLKPFKDKSKKSALHCTHCGYNGHTIDKCFQFHGYPPGWNGPKGKKNVASAHAAITTPEVYNQKSTEQPKFCFTPEEFNKLMALANSTQLNSSTQNILQPAVNLATTSYFSGATDHMICSPLFYHSTPKPINASINLPNGITVPATHIGPVNGEDDWDCPLRKKDFTI
ncbi:hypothetical protein Acr_20g0006540 [Actinidia rufa]|uniref:Retrotransposon Copia-like N-terminal domain-containing protein n=1 Tax=Actinidia rufa TaxID=165716 RepID=A0A7J0GDF4_9ERIC|nr:hypothetical protein Acr_20g0006540 [Actinidia rufa]